MSDDSSPLFVEFVGVPGVGKSTLATTVGNRLEREGFEVHHPINRINTAPTSNRIPKKVAYSGLSCVTAPRFCTQSIAALPWTNLVTSREARSVIFNWFFVNGVSRQYCNRTGVTVLDQGPLQGYWSITLSESSAANRQLQLLLREWYQSIPTVVVQVIADQDTIHDRLTRRDSNPSRVKPTTRDGYSVEVAFDVYDETRTVIESLSADCPHFEVLTVTNEVPDDIDANVDKIVKRVNQMVTA